MCGRFTIAKAKDELVEYINSQYNIVSIPIDFNIPNYNISPGNDIISVIYDGNVYRIGLLKWGYLPNFPIKDRNGFINARAETIFDKPSFKKAALKQRCVVLADGYYEWDKERQPMRITTDGKFFSMAGIWNTTEVDGKKVHTVAIITTTAHDNISDVHNRMPVILDYQAEKIWLDPNKDIEELQAVLIPYQGIIDLYPVSKAVNYSKNNYQELIFDIRKNA